MSRDSNPFRAATARAAARNWTASRSRTGRFPWSSSHPARATMKAPGPRASARRPGTMPANVRPARAARKTATKASPPPRGVGASWRLLAFGMSMSERESEYRSTSPVRAAERTSAVKQRRNVRAGGLISIRAFSLSPRRPGTSGWSRQWPPSGDASGQTRHPCGASPTRCAAPP